MQQLGQARTGLCRYTKRRHTRNLRRRLIGQVGLVRDCEHGTRPVPELRHTCRIWRPAAIKHHQPQVCCSGTVQRPAHTFALNLIRRLAQPGSIGNGHGPATQIEMYLDHVTRGPFRCRNNGGLPRGDGVQQG